MEIGVAESVRDVREFLVIGPSYLVLASSVMVIMRGSGSIFEILPMVYILSLREPCPGWLPPSVIVLEKYIIQVHACIDINQK